MSKRGQQTSASGAAVLIILIAAVFVLYILFLPPEDRAELLGELNESDDDGVSSKDESELLRESVGRLDYLKFDYREHDIPSFRIYSETNGVAIKSIPSVYIKNNLVGETSYDMTFSIDSRLTSNMLVSFNIASSRGRLQISLNGHEIFNSYLEAGSPNPISLPDEYLQNDNSLIFKVSGVGAVFWRTNGYALNNVIVTGDILDVSNSKSSQFFYVSNLEYDNLDSVKLKFHPECDSYSVGLLKIYLNGDQMFSGIADCGIFNTVFMDVNSIMKDRNELEFVATSGYYLIDNIEVRTELEELIFPVYYFDLSDDVFHQESINDIVFDVLDDDYDVTLDFRFVNDDEKRLEYLINGIRKHVVTDNVTFGVLLDDYVLPGTNSLELIPKSIVDIAEMKVSLKE